MSHCIVMMCHSSMLPLGMKHIISLNALAHLAHIAIVLQKPHKIFIKPTEICNGIMISKLYVCRHM